MSTEDDYYYQRVQSLVDGLVRRTRTALQNDERMWEQPDRDVYELSLKRTSIRIYTADRDGQKPYILELYDGFGSMVDDVRDDGWGSPVKLDELYNLVSRGEKHKARESALQDALSELEIPEPPLF